jgi:hypothetical protein
MMADNKDPHELEAQFDIDVDRVDVESLAKPAHMSDVALIVQAVGVLTQAHGQAISALMLGDHKTALVKLRWAERSVSRLIKMVTEDIYKRDDANG